MKTTLLNSKIRKFVHNSVEEVQNFIKILEVLFNINFTKILGVLYKLTHNSVPDIWIVL